MRRVSSPESAALRAGAARFVGPARAEPLRSGDSLAQIVGDSEATRRLRRAIVTAAASESTVLLTGETGTGKGLAARALHSSSARCDRPFVHVDCASLSPSLIESELFGHERGAFTGAVVRRTGRFELATGGTLFLDEIGELPPELQAKLLRVLQDREFERIGGSQTLALSARVVAASNQDLARAVRARRFRADLYFRLKVLHVRVPPLRLRAADVRPIVRAAIDRLAPRFRRRPPKIDDACWDGLERYSWPGNVRELTNLVERLLVLGADPWLEADLVEALEPCGDEVREQWDLPLVGSNQTAASSERERIEEALRRSNGNVARAARRLDLPRSTLRYRIFKLRLEAHAGSGAAH